MLDFGIVKRQVINAYFKLNKNSTLAWSLDDVMMFFKIFYAYHSKYAPYEHPHLKSESIEWIILNVSNDDTMEYNLDTYKAIIPQYFRTRFDDCDYSILHFMSGDIRLLRYYETCY